MSALDTRPHTGPTPSPAAAAERRRIERDLHDGAQTLLVSMRLKLGLAADRAAELDADLHRLLMEVGDDGHGGADPSRGTGLRGIERRLAAFDGTMTLSSPPGGPTIVTMELPCALSSPRTTLSSATD